MIFLMSVLFGMGAYDSGFREPVLSLFLRPTGWWRLATEGLALMASFSREKVTSLIVERDDTRSRLNIDLRTEDRPLSPGQTLEVEQEYRWGRW
jgi:hypothetical protein